MRPVWFIGGVLAFALGFIGAFVPLIPTVPLVLLAAFCFARSSDAAHNWLITHKNFGKLIADWHERGAISSRAKLSAGVAIALTILISVYLEIPAGLLTLQIVVLCCVALFIWSRPSG